MSSEFINLDTSSGLAASLVGPPLLASATDNPVEKQAFTLLIAQEMQQNGEPQNKNANPRLDAISITALKHENSAPLPVSSVMPLDAIEPTRGSRLPSRGKNEDQLLSSDQRLSSTNDAQNVFSPMWIEPEIENSIDLQNVFSSRVRASELTMVSTAIPPSVYDTATAVAPTASLSTTQLTEVDADLAFMMKKPPRSNPSQLLSQADSPLLQSRTNSEAIALARPVLSMAASNEHNITKELAGINVDDTRPVVYVENEKMKNETLLLDHKRNLFSLGPQYTNADYSSQLNLGENNRGNGADLYNLLDEKASNLLNFDVKPEVPTSRPIFDLPVGLNLQQQVSTDSVMPKSFYQLMGQTTDSRWGEELGTKLQMLIQNNIQQAQFHINPKNLGPLDVLITVTQDQQVNIGFSVQQGALKDTLDAALPRLREMLQEQGLSLNNVDIGQRNSGNEKQTPSQYKNQGAMEEDVIATSTNVPETTQSMLVGLGTVDLFA